MRILLVEDDPMIGKTLHAALQQRPSEQKPLWQLAPCRHWEPFCWPTALQWPASGPPWKSQV